MKRRILSVVLMIVLAVTCLSVSAPEAAAADHATWKIKVNISTNVVTIYKKRGDSYYAYRAMVCSSGGEKTPTGTYDLKKKWDWGLMVDGTYGRYVTQINGNYLFHSVPYLKKNRKDQCDGSEYNKLGTGCSHGCIRLAIVDAKWIYDNCPVGTEIKLFRGKRADDPLGKPEPLKVEEGTVWDPTEQDKDNPDLRLRKATIRISDEKKNVVPYRTAYDLLQYVTAENPGAKQDLTSKITVSAVKRRSDEGTWEAERFSTKKPGTYQITYQVKDAYCAGTTEKKWEVKVTADSKAPDITAFDRTVHVGDQSAVKGVSAWQQGCNRTAAIEVYINKPGLGGEKKYTYHEAAAYVFEKTGTYKVRYVVSNRYDADLKAEAEIEITSERAAATAAAQNSAVSVDQKDSSQQSVRSLSAASQSDLAAEWIWKRQLSNGAIAASYSSEKLAHVEPYDSAEAALALIRHDDSASARKRLQRYFDWHFAHLNGAAEDENGLEGTIDAYDLRLEQGEVVREQSGASEQTAGACSAVFLNALAEYVKHDGSEAYIRAHAADVGRIVNAMFSVMSDGYAAAKPAGNTYHLQDNCQVYAGLKSALYLYQEVLKDDALKQKVSEALEYNQKHFIKDWWKGDHFAAALDKTLQETGGFSWKTFDEKTVSQVYPLFCGIVDADSQNMQNVYKRLCKTCSWEHMKSGRKEAADSYSVLAAAGVMMQDQERFQTYLLTWKDKQSGEQERVRTLKDAAMFVYACDLWNR